MHITAMTEGFAVVLMTTRRCY